MIWPFQEAIVLKTSPSVQYFLLNYVRAARDAIYKRASAICGVVVDRLLKPTSSVPTLVSFFVPCYADL